MKLLARTLSLLAIASLTLFFSNCGKGGGETAPEKVALGKLSKTWNIVSADRSGTPADETADFTNFDLTISGTFNSGSPEGPYDYDVSGGQPVLSPWPQGVAGTSGTWTFAGIPEKNEGLIGRNDDVAMYYILSSNGQLTLTFNLPIGGGYQARTSQVEGDWTFVFD